MQRAWWQVVTGAFPAQAGRVTTKNSCARNLSRLLSGVAFISSLLQRLACRPGGQPAVRRSSNWLWTVGV